MKTLHTIAFIVFFISAIIGILVEKDPTWSMACLAMAGVERLEMKDENNRPKK